MLVTKSMCVMDWWKTTASSSPETSCPSSQGEDPKDKSIEKNLNINELKLPIDQQILSATLEHQLTEATSTDWDSFYWRQFTLLPSRCSAWLPVTTRIALMKTMPKYRPCWKKSTNSPEHTRVPPTPTQRKMLISPSTEMSRESYISCKARG